MYGKVDEARKEKNKWAYDPFVTIDLEGQKGLSEIQSNFLAF